jgi:1-acyl-sn-glycerol-3-phosphate acyltransferase
MGDAYPVPGRQFPVAGKPVARALGRLMLRLAGWRVEGEMPDTPQLVACVAPHTSNWDFVIGYLAKMALDVRAHWLGKHTLFRGPLGPLLRAMGGIAVDRSAAHGVVAQAVNGFRTHPRLLLGVAPEGTRSRVTRWKSGFYHIARGAGVPIWPVALDWGVRTLRLGPLFRPTGDEDADIAALQSFFTRVRGRNPERAFPPPADDTPIRPGTE